MQKIKHYTEDAFEFFIAVVNNKNKGFTKDTVAALEDRIKLLFDIYTNSFKTDKLGNLIHASFLDSEVNALSNLYSYKSRCFKKLTQYLTTDEHGRKQNKCPFCTINDVSTLDHYLPKNEFVEFAANPLNLIPCCPECNSLKSSLWRFGTERSCLNLYIDDIPQVQYLFVDILIEDGTLKCEFYIDNRNNIESNLYNRIKKHYSQLKLLERFKKNSDYEITDLQSVLHSHFHSHSLDNEENYSEIKKNIYSYIELMRDKFGCNYWKIVLKDACIHNENIFTFLIKTF